MTIKRKFDLSSDEVKKKCLNDIIAIIDDTLDEKIGVITAGEILDTITQSIGPDLYNEGIEDAKELIRNRSADTEVDLDMLKANG